MLHSWICLGLSLFAPYSTPCINSLLIHPREIRKSLAGNPISETHQVFGFLPSHLRFTRLNSDPSKRFFFSKVKSVWGRGGMMNWGWKEILGRVLWGGKEEEGRKVEFEKVFLFEGFFFLENISGFYYLRKDHLNEKESMLMHHYEEFEQYLRLRESSGWMLQSLDLIISFFFFFKKYFFCNKNFSMIIFMDLEILLAQFLVFTIWRNLNSENLRLREN